MQKMFQLKANINKGADEEKLQELNKYLSEGWVIKDKDMLHDDKYYATWTFLLEYSGKHPINQKIVQLKIHSVDGVDEEQLKELNNYLSEGWNIQSYQSIYYTESQSMRNGICVLRKWELRIIFLERPDEALKSYEDSTIAELR